MTSRTSFAVGNAGTADVAIFEVYLLESSLLSHFVSGAGPLSTTVGFFGAARAAEARSAIGTSQERMGGYLTPSDDVCRDIGTV